MKSYMPFHAPCILILVAIAAGALMFYLGRRTRPQQEKDAAKQRHPEITPQPEMPGFDNQER